MVDAACGRIFFSGAQRSLEAEDEIELVTVGVDIGSSTSHLVFSRLRLERTDTRYVVAERTVLHRSEILLTPYSEENEIDTACLGAFIGKQYAQAGLAPSQIDTGALILTGVAVRRRNARVIGELFAAQAGRFVAVSAGDALETTLSAYGSGAVARSIREGLRIMNVDIGGGTSKISVCEAGAVCDVTAIDVGARLVCLAPDGRVLRLEAAGRRFADELGLSIAPGVGLPEGAAEALAGRMADRLVEAMQNNSPSPGTEALLRLEPLREGPRPALVTFSGGVAEFIHDGAAADYGDLGGLLAAAVRARVEAWGVPIGRAEEGIRATVIGASQYTVQVSGSTIFVCPESTALPVRNVPVLAPELPLAEEALDPAAIAESIRLALARYGLQDGVQTVALCYRWAGSASYARLDAFARGVGSGLSDVLASGLPLVLVGEGDVGGLIGIHCREELRLTSPIVSIDGITVNALDYLDIGAILATSGAVPVVVKSLVFPTSSAPGRATGPG